MDIKALKDEIDGYLSQYFKGEKSYNKTIYEAMSYSINIGGKRIRPILLLLSYSLFKDDYKKVMPIAGAVEMIHTYSLIHDDLPCMDDDDLRRGKPTSHKVFGEAMAVLAGDALLNESVNIMFKYCLETDSNALKACSLIANAAGADGMIGGQVVDMMSEGRIIDANELLYMHNCKTGELIKASILSGAELAKADEKEKDILEQYGKKLGLAFQIKDDILNVTGTKELLGKSVSSDEKNQKTNFITTYGLEKCMTICDELTQECIDLLGKLGRETTLMKELTMFLLKREY